MDACRQTKRVIFRTELRMTLKCLYDKIFMVDDKIGGLEENIMDRDFPLNRFDFSDLAKCIQKSEVLSEVITDSETGIEF